MEPSHSGLVHHLGKVADLKGSREFKSLRFRRLFDIHKNAIMSL